MKRSVIISAVSALLLLILLMATDPSKLPSFILVIPFILIFTIIWSLSFSSLRGANMTRLRSARLSLVLAGLPVSLMLLQSIGQLTVRDIVTILAFFGLAYFYISRIVASAE